MAALAAAESSMGAVRDVGELQAEAEPAMAASCGGSLSPAIRLSKSRRNLFAQMLTSSAEVEVLQEDVAATGAEAGAATTALLAMGLSGGGGSALSLVVTGLLLQFVDVAVAVAIACAVGVVLLPLLHVAVLLLSKPLSDSVERDNSSSCLTAAASAAACRTASSCSCNCCCKRCALRSSKTSLISSCN